MTFEASAVQNNKTFEHYPCTLGNVNKLLLVNKLCMVMLLTTSKVGGGDTGTAGRSVSSPYLAGYSSAQATQEGQDAATSRNTQCHKTHNIYITDQKCSNGVHLMLQYIEAYSSANDECTANS